LHNAKHNVDINPISFSELENFIRKELNIIRKQLLVSRSAVEQLGPDSPMTAYLRNKHTILAMCSINKCRNTLRIYAFFDKSLQSSSSEKKINQLSREIHQPGSEDLLDLDELDTEMRLLGCDKMYK
jgi:hypothetical protein